MPTLMGWADPPLDHPNHFPFMQAGLYFLEIHNTYRFRAFWRISCEYFALDLCFLTNLSPSLAPFILSLPSYIYHFLGRLYMDPGSTRYWSKV